MNVLFFLNIIRLIRKQTLIYANAGGAIALGLQFLGAPGLRTLFKGFPFL